MNVAIWGAGITGKRVLSELIQNKEMNEDGIVFLDSNLDKHKTMFEGHMVYHYSWLKTNSIDLLVLGTYTGYREILSILQSMNADIKRIDASYVELQYTARIAFLHNLAPLLSDVMGCVAEVGVYRGEFAKYINQYFDSRTLYLYDTFQGFDAQDVYIEKTKNQNLVSFRVGALSDTSEEFVMSKMKNPDKVRIIKGHFPDSFDQSNERFAFVNVDMDLYEPTKKAICIFYPLMEQKGVILIHDFYNPDCQLVSQAVCDAERELGISFIKLPVGDKMSVAIIKD